MGLLSATDYIASFPTKTLPPIADTRSRPTYASLRLAQTELNGNAASVHSNLGGGLHGHLALTLSDEDYLFETGVVFAKPPNPPPTPVLPPTPTTAQITEANRQNTAAKELFQTYHAVDKALRNQILAAVPEVYVRALRHTITGYGNVTSLRLLTHLWDKYGKITQSELDSNEARMNQPWNPPTPIETLFKQLEDGLDFARAGEEELALNQVLRMGYNNIHKTGFFNVACREWRQTDPATRTMNDFQDHFRAADTDRIDNSTTGQSGYHGPTANHAAASPSTNDDAATLASHQAQATIAAKDAQIERLLAAMQSMNSNTNKPSKPQDQGSVFSAITAATSQPTDTGTTSYCWTHGHSRNLRHDSTTCQHKGEGHQDSATATNTQGGSDRHWGRS
jgi:hypothetical protein